VVIGGFIATLRHLNAMAWWSFKSVGCHVDTLATTHIEVRAVEQQRWRLGNADGRQSFPKRRALHARHGALGQGAGVPT
jgi:hypothetical protein